MKQLFLDFIQGWSVGSEEVLTKLLCWSSQSSSFVKADLKYWKMGMLVKIGTLFLR